MTVLVPRQRAARGRGGAASGEDDRGAGPRCPWTQPEPARSRRVRAGVVTVRIAELERINRLDPLEVFTVYDGQVVEKGDLVASVKIAPHLVDAGVIEAGARIAGFGSQPIVSVARSWPDGSGRREGIRSGDRPGSGSRHRSEPRSKGWVRDHRHRVCPRRCRRGRDRARPVHPWCGDRGPDPDGGFGVDRPRGRVLRRDRGARRAGRPPGCAVASRLDAVARAGRRDVDPRAADVWGVFEGYRCGPVATAAPGG